ncbi:hypothetical protein [Streptomyces syringium]|uniref:hypothetical protein n=1 Tax=Streptomyces syringium TaxID=76729 RepID=UPI0033E837DD
MELYLHLFQPYGRRTQQSDPQPYSFGAHAGGPPPRRRRAGPLERQMIPAGSQVRYTTVLRTAKRYKVHPNAALQWTREPDFPDVIDKAQQSFVYDESKVDDWVKKHRPGLWASGQESAEDLGLPEGNDRDLLTLEEIGEIEGAFLGREATPVETLRTYLSPSKATLPGPDRQPGDGGKPEVAEKMWFRSTAYDFIKRPRKVRRKKTETTPAEKKAPATPRAAVAEVALPAGSPTDLLTLKEIAELDAAARGRSKPLALSSLANYRSRGLLAKPDRLPGDEHEPEVAEEMWFRSTAYEFINSRRKAGRPSKA